MGRERKTKVVHYKHVQFNSKGDTLKTILDRALKKLNTVGQRKRNISVNPDTKEWEVLGDIEREKNGFTFGTLMTYTPGLQPLFLLDDELAETITLERYEPPANKDGKPRELLESVLFLDCFASGSGL